MFHVNIQSLKSKISEFEIFLQNYNFGFLFVNEHWCKYDEIGYLNICNYDLISSFCRRDHIHGGVAIYALKVINNCVSLDNINNLSIEIHCEMAAAAYKNIKFMTVYRSPDGNFDMFLERLNTALNFLIKNTKIIFVTGDFNVHFHEKNDKNASTLINLFH